MKKFEEFTNEEGDSTEHIVDLESQSSFSKKDLMDAAFAFTNDAASVEKGFEEWFTKNYNRPRKRFRF